VDNTWEFKPGVYVLDLNVTFASVQGVVGGSGNDTFKYEGATFKGTIDGGGGHNTLDTGANQFTNVTLLRGSVSNNGFYGWISSIADTFDEIDSIVSLVGDGSTLNGSSPNFTGDFSGTLSVSGFDNFSLDVPGNFSGSLLASTEGTAANPIGPITVGGSVTNTSVIKVGFLSTFSVAGDMAGTLKGFGSDANTPTLQTVSIGGNLTATGEVISAGQLGTVKVVGNLAGTVDENTPPGIDMQSLSVGGSLSGTVNAGSIAEMVVTEDLSGTVSVSGPIGTVTIGGSETGSIKAGQITSIGVGHAAGPVLLDITQGGVERKLVVKTDAAAGAAPNTLFSYYYYDGSTAIPEASVRVNPQPLPPGDPPAPFDLSLVVHGQGKFDLARLDSVGSDGQPAVAHVHDIAIDGDLLSTVSTAAMKFFNLPANAPGGVQLTMDDLGSVAATDNVAAGTVVAHSLRGLAFGSVTEANGKTVSAPDAQENDAAIIAILIGYPPPQVESSLLVPVSARQPVALFVNTQSASQSFDTSDVLLADQANTLPLGPPLSLDPIITTLQIHSNAALVGPSSAPSVIQSVAFDGDGGSVTTAQPIAQSITSTGPLGDLVLESPQGLTASVTAPSIPGNMLVPNGPIAGTIQTTGIRTDPTTGATTQVPADLGRLTTDASGQPNGTTRILAGSGITGRIISRGDLISRVVANGGIDGVIAVQGNLGAVERNADGSVAVGASGSLTRFGGVEADGGYRGILIGLDNAYGDIVIEGGLSGRIAFQGQPIAGLDASRIGILGNVDIHGPVRRHGAVVSGGEIGDAANGTDLTTAAVEGTVAALGNINLARGKTDDAQFFGGNLTGANAAAVEAIFSKAFDLNPTALDLKGLDQMLAKLAALNLTTGGGSSTLTEDYVAAVYVDLLGREADGGGLNYWSGQLAGGAPRGQIAGQLTHSDEYFAGIVTPAYQQYLGRTPDAAGLQYWIAQMHEGLTDEQIEARFIGSPEFFAHSGGTNKAWVDAMYQDLLGRAADPQGESYWVSRLEVGADRASVAYGFAASLERERQRISGDYLHYLGRLPDAAGLDYWLSQFAQGLTNEEVITGFIASDEYFGANTSAGQSGP
ncbi:MAG TPA: DUF4214 domain-containing protein, partial [Pirellulales bacterium]|jgi:hypothetical protein|nr:DUF4214 domain-containing protein [Pirellulales bacterium]